MKILDSHKFRAYCHSGGSTVLSSPSKDLSRIFRWSDSGVATLPQNDDGKIRNNKFLLVLSLILLAELGSSVWYLKNKGLAQNQQQPSPIVQAQKPVVLFFDPSSQEFSIEEEFQINIILDTADKQAVGADIILEYDPKALEILAVTPGSIFSFYPEPKIGKEKIFISGIGQIEETFTGRGIFVQLNLKSKTPGKTELRFNFDPGQTNDSNVAIKNSEKDSLEKIENGSYYLNEIDLNK